MKIIVSLYYLYFYREEARTIFVNYLTHYSPGKRLEKYIQFFVTQLNYELQHGRESSLKFLDMIIGKLNTVSIKIYFYELPPLPVIVYIDTLFMLMINYVCTYFVLRA